MNLQDTPIDSRHLALEIKDWGKSLGFQQVGIGNTDLDLAETRLDQWLARGYHGEMAFMAHHGRKRSRPEELVPGTRSIISVRMDYLPKNDQARQVLDNPALGYVSRYALGRDYHKLMRKRLQQLARRIERAVGAFGYRAFVDSAPVLEKPLSQKAGLGWVGKHSNLVSREAGCWFFLGELYTDLLLPTDRPETDHCGRCSACIDICPTQAIVAPYQVDARRCISYLTIELKGSIPVELRPGIGNRIYGCDDCLMACPWNRFAEPTRESDFLPRNGLDASTLVALSGWSENQFLSKLEGSPIRRIGHERWLRNIAVALGNAPSSSLVTEGLRGHENHPSERIREHVRWALQQHHSPNGPRITAHPVSAP
ncbi:MAG: tRNA epoxyqueuosine(34) reductase QueG [Gammaproteobacteria bacterium]|nr:tRNA epoxyqueuosine(34) reductase QueG [Gammaproteobacteria bacterium]